MKALILAAGKGTRLRPLTYSTPKPLIPVANKPTVFYAIENLAKFGVTDIGLVINQGIEEEIRKVMANLTVNVNITYLYQNEPKGLAHAVACGREFIGNDDFILQLGDNIIMSDDPYRHFTSTEPRNKVLLSPVENPTAFGVAIVKDGKITKLVEKPKVPPSNLAIVGLYRFTSEVFNIIDQLKPSARGEYEVTDAIQSLIDNGYDVEGVVYDDWWKDTGKVDDILTANKYLLERRVNVNTELEFTIVNSLVDYDKKFTVGEGSNIDSSEICSYATVGKNCKIKNCRIENSIILDNVTLENVSLKDSIIGNGVVMKSDKKQDFVNVVLGDHSSLVLH